MNDSIFKAYDIRGIVPEELDTATARAIGAAFAKFLSGGRILIGRDMRPSGSDLAAAFTEGANSQGAEVVSIGLCSTDLMYFASGKMNMPGAMFTASHNPAQYNGIKLCGTMASPISSDTGLEEIKKFAVEFAENPPSSRNSYPSTVDGVGNSEVEMLTAYVEHVRSFTDVSKLRGLKVVADTANGMGGLVVPAVFEGLGVELDILFPELDGTFPNHPADPIQPENLVDLKARVHALGADVGLAFDGDADRVFLVDNRSNPVSGSTTTAIVAKEMLRTNPGATILYNLICSKSVPKIVEENGGVAIKTRVGHSFIKARMAETGAVFGGEHSGHYYFKDNYRADSGLIAAFVVLGLLAASEQPLSELRIPFERFSDSGEVNTKVRDANAVIEFIENAYVGRSTAEHLDGLTVDLGDWWFNVRPSNTEPLLRLNLEARTAQEVSARLQEVLAVIAKADSMKA